MARKKKRKPTLRVARNRLLAAKSIANNDQYTNIRRAFLDKFTYCDVSCKAILEGYLKYKGTYNPAKFVDLNMKQIPAAMELFGLDVERNLLNSIFGGSGKYKKRGTKSAKKLRDGLVHAMNAADVNEIVDRYDELDSLMDRYLSIFE